MQTTRPSPPSPPVPDAVHDLLERAATGLRAACACDRVDERYRCAHLAAIRAAAAVLAARAAPTGRRRPRSVWDLLCDAAPELGEWAAFLAAAGRRRQGLESGLARVSPREADDLVRQVQAFLGLVRTHLLGDAAARDTPGGDALVLIPAHSR